MFQQISEAISNRNCRRYDKLRATVARSRSLRGVAGVFALTGLVLATASLIHFWTGTAAVVRAQSAPTLDADTQSATAFQQKITPLLQQYCYECHGNGEHTANLTLDSFKTIDDVTKGAKTWETVLRYVRSHEMPPEDHPQPSEADRLAISDWVDGELCSYYLKHPDPGRVTYHRLNRAEYNATIRDLVGIDFHPADDFPVDDSGYGFDNIGDVLSLPPVLMEKYLTAADKIMDQAIATDPIGSHNQHIPASLAEVGFNAFGDRGDGWVKLVSLEEDDVAVEVPVGVAGDYYVRVLAYAKPDGGVAPYNPNGFGARGGIAGYRKGIASGPPRFWICLNDAIVQDFAVTTDEANPQLYEVRMGVPTGKQRFRAAMRRVRGGEGELVMKNGRLGREQTGTIFVKYIEIEGPLASATRRYPAAALEPDFAGKSTPDGSRLLTDAADVGVDINVPQSGEYILRAQAYAMQAGDEPARMEFRIDGKPIRTFDVFAPGKMEALSTQRIFSLALLVPAPQVYQVHATLAPGKRHFSAAFINPFADPKNVNPNLRQRSLTIQNLEITNPSEGALPPPMPQPLREIFDRHLKNNVASNKTPEAARAILTDFTRRAWRRPVQRGELDRLMALFDLATKQNDGFEAAVKLAMKATLVSPHFLFRGEIQTDPNNANSVHPVDEYALASRLSYFIWSSMPDDELLDLAARGELRKNLDAQVKRLLASPKAQSMVTNFAGQWLQFRGLDTVAPDKTIYDNYDPYLRSAMQKETELFFEYIMLQDRSVMDFINADYTFVNARLATHYSIPNITGDEFRKVSLDGLPRRGILTQASVLTLTSNPSRTSPVKRGKWVLENVLGTPPPPPPPNVPPLEKEGVVATGTLRHQMEQHRADPNCASCHARMDPIGFALENFDGIGQWRTEDGDAKIDASGKLVTGESFTNPLQLVDILGKARKDDFVRCLSEKMLTYGLGRGLEYYDYAAIQKIAKGVKDNDYHFSSLVMEVVNSVPFQMERGEGAVAAK
jgi:hypothetical protein